VLTRFALLLAALGLFLALGRFNPLFPYYAQLPGLSAFRCPIRFILFIHFAGAIGAAVLWCRLTQIQSVAPLPWKRLAWLLPLPLLAWLAIPALKPLLLSARLSTPWVETLPVLPEFELSAILKSVMWSAGLIVLLVPALRAWRPAQLALLVFILAEQYTFSRWAITDMPQVRLDAVLTTPVPAESENGDRFDYPLPATTRSTWFLSSEFGSREDIAVWIRSGAWTTALRIRAGLPA